MLADLCLGVLDWVEHLDLYLKNIEGLSVVEGQNLEFSRPGFDSAQEKSQRQGFSFSGYGELALNFTLKN
jgi:hypothetical protein